MHTVSRRGFLTGVGASIAGAHYIAAPRSTDIRIEEVTSNYEEFRYRTPYKFGGVPVDRVTLLNVSCRVSSRNGKESRGFGSMPLGNVWSFPSREMSYDTTLTAMKRLSERIVTIANSCKEYGHPLDLHAVLEPQFLNAAREVSSDLKLLSPIPVLCTLVTASALDAAIHDGFGRVHRRSCYRTYGSDLLSRDLSAFLNTRFQRRMA